MDLKAILRFRNASKAGTSSEFSVRQFRSISIGRDPSCEVAYDPDRDDLVSRLHAKITIEASNPPSFILSDFGSRNGTFVNRQRIAGAVKITPGDLIQLGPGGPEIEFDLDPKPAVPKATRLAEATAASPNPVIERELPPTLTMPPSAPPPLPVIQKKSSKTIFFILGGLLGLVILAGGTLAIPTVCEKLGIFSKYPKRTPAEIAKLSGESVVLFESAWKLLDLETGKQLHHLHIPNRQIGPDTDPALALEIVPGGPSSLPAFVQTPGGGVEPVLTIDEQDGPALGSAGSGSGFIVSADGFILTNRHLTSNWLAPWTFSSPAGAMLQNEADGPLKATPVATQTIPAWVPAKAQFVINGKFDPQLPILQQGSQRVVKGRNEALHVTLPPGGERFEAKLIRASEPADIAVLKIDPPRQLKKLDLYDNALTIAAGDPVSVLAYPSVAPALSVGSIGTKGDTYRITVSSTGPGNSGGPVLDDRGRVIGVFTQTPAEAAAAVPVRYGIELIGSNR